MLTIAVEFFQDLSLLGWDWISQRRWTLLLIQFSGERRPAASQAWAGISPITSGWGSPRPRPRRVMRQQSLLIMPPPPSDNWPGYWVYISFASSRKSCCFLLDWLFVNTSQNIYKLFPIRYLGPHFLMFCCGFNTFLHRENVLMAQFYNTSRLATNCLEQTSVYAPDFHVYRWSQTFVIYRKINIRSFLEIYILHFIECKMWTREEEFCVHWKIILILSSLILISAIRYRDTEIQPTSCECWAGN